MESQLAKRDKIGVQDFVLLEDYRSENAFVENLKKRYQENLIYTYIGSVLVSVNPYKTIPGLYGTEAMDEYRGVNLYELPPHIYAIADAAYRSMREEAVDQCVLISGESGAGKTEASKKILHYLASCSGHAGDVDRVKERLLQSNPVLEAFGNAKTIRNDNSSRFGKYMDIEFDYKGSPVGGHINNYLLEKSRVVTQAQGERNFHIFYQLLAGAGSSLLSQLQLKSDPQSYRLLCQGDCTNVKTINDKSDFVVVQQALSVLGFQDIECQGLWEIVGGVMHLGNLDYVRGDTDESSQLKDTDQASVLAKLLQCSAETLEKSLTHRTIEARGEKLLTPLSVEQALYARDALAKATYERMFQWLVRRLNSSLENKTKVRKNVMGLLDIYGFEIFVVNSFEQFCINYCNEKLQQLFIELTLKSEQEEYFQENIEWEPVEYFNNKIICDLVEEKHKGIIAILDEECLRPGEVSDDTFLERLCKGVGNHAHFISHQTTDYEGRKTLARNEFRLCHYAGDVTYCITGFVDKNNDLLYRDLKEAMSGSSNVVLKDIFTLEELQSKKRPPTAATQFKTSLAELMVILMSKQPSYVRCIKPNDDKRPALLDEKIIFHQVKYLGLMENLRVRRAGFCYRRPFAVFLERYKSLCPKTWPTWRGNDRDGIRELCTHLGYTSEQYKIGKTKIFIRFPKTLFETEDRFQNRKHELVTQITALFRMYQQRKVYHKMQWSVTMIAKHWRRVTAQRYAKRYRAAAMVVRKFVIGFKNRNKPKCPENVNFLEFVRVNFLKRLSQQLPRNVLDHSWPTPPPALVEASDMLRLIHQRNMVRGYMQKLTPERKAQLSLKLTASEAFKGRKEAYPASVAAPFVSNRLAPSEQQYMQTNCLNKFPGLGTVKYAAHCTKYDRHGYKPRPRVIAITDKGCLVLESGTYKLKEQHLFESISGIVVSSLTDGVIIIRLPTDSKDCKGDLLIEVEHVIEFLIKLLSEHSNKLECLSIDSSGNVTHNLVGNKSGTILFHKGNEKLISKTKTGELQVIAPPSGVRQAEALDVSYL
ncbi:unconventional myosin-Ic-like [Dysidea avara]|uniref:unconventional myosin-Ic-like n=1 Tax=Dysidea avara TaxID=196820 RepID=UPI003332122D